MDFIMMIDAWLFHQINLAGTHFLIDWLAVIFMQLGTVRIMFPILILIFYLTKKENSSNYIVLLAATLFIEIFFAHLLKQIFDRPRPFEGLSNIVVNGDAQISILYLIDHFPFFSNQGPGLNWQGEFGLGLSRSASFPSGHAHVMAGAGTVLADKFQKHRKLIMTLFCCAAFTRVYVGVHYPIDIVAGIVFGVSIAKAVLWIDSRRAPIGDLNNETRL